MVKLTPIVPLLVLAYWAPNHMDINENVLRKGKPFAFTRADGKEVKTVDDFLRRQWFISEGINHEVKGVAFQKTSGSVIFGSYEPPALDKPSDGPNETHSLVEWNRFGGLWEDGFQDGSEATKWGGLRAVNHFHNPLATNGGGYTGIRTADGIEIHKQDKTGLPYLDLLRVGASSTQWVMGGGAKETNAWSYPAGVECLSKFGVNILPSERQSGLACAFRVMGQVEHLVEDNTVPDHARDLAHPGDGFEEYLRDTRPDLFANAPQPWPELPMTLIESKGLRALWDTDLYSASNPSQATAGKVGIDEFTQANFLAWNRLVKWVSVPPLVLEFTTVPDAPNTPYPSLPWPRLAEPSGGVYPSAPATLPLSCLAKSRLLRKNAIDATCWQGYAEPLMKIAHGYPLDVLRLGLWPARAELVPDTTLPLDVRRFRLRVWHLGSGEQALTWNVDELKLLGLQPEAAQGGGANGAITVGSAAGVTIAPGTMWQSPPFSLEINEQTGLIVSSHTMVSIKAHLGTGPTQTAIVISAPIPNGLGVIDQLTTDVDTSAAPGELTGTRTTSDCCGAMACSPCGEDTDVQQPHHQKVTGTLKLLASKVDVLGAIADSTVQAAQRFDARIAGAAVVGYTKVGTRYFAPVLSNKIKLTVTGLDCIAPYFCTRKADAPDAADDPAGMPFTLDFDTADFLAASAGPPGATQSIYFLMWTTSGAIFTQNVVLWPVMSTKNVPDELARGTCDGVGPRFTVQQENSGGCTSSAQKTQCSGTFISWVRRGLFGPLRGLAVAGIDDGKFFTFTGTMKIDRLADVNVGAMSAVCPSVSQNMGNYDISCFSDFNSFVLRQTQTTGMGACPPLPAKPAIPHTAHYTRTWQPMSRDFIVKLWGITELPVSSLELR